MTLIKRFPQSLQMTSNAALKLNLHWHSTICYTCFAKLNHTVAYLQVEVFIASRELLTINIHHGLFQFTRLPIGIKIAPAIFQQIMDTMLIGVNGAVPYPDDIIGCCG